MCILRVCVYYVSSLWPLSHQMVVRDNLMTLNYFINECALDVRLPHATAIVMKFHINGQSLNDKMKGCYFDHCQQFSYPCVTQWKYLC